jgi:hypothetical protein
MRKERERKALQALIDQFVKPAVPPLEAVAAVVVEAVAKAVESMRRANKSILLQKTYS